ncbi:tol-pal system protein YbgF [Megalodesulfovibrio gigas]|uniref:tol-pal system protein YbgF n=1 Tax=Megalodesulfovibrio gigas TaxID=879 RepID=UPI0003FBDC8B|nr:tol-pal system protein YbgF [Megalodesulfovibrio gigas]
MPVLLLVSLLCGVMLCGCASRQQVEELEERLDSMGGTVEQLAVGQDIARAETSTRLGLIEDSLLADGKEKTRLLQEIKAGRQLRAAAARAAQIPQAPPAPAAPADWAPPATQEPAPKIVAEQQPSTLHPEPATPAPLVTQPVPVQPPSEKSPAADPVLSVFVPNLPEPPAAPEVVKRPVSKPSPGIPGYGGGSAAAEGEDPAVAAGLDPYRIVSRPIVQENTPGAAPTPPATPTPPAAGAKPAAASPASVEEAVKLVQAGKVERGRQMLTAYIQENPKGGMLPNAYYWLGETYFQDKRYAQAILAFKDVTTRYPKHDRASAALLKIGLAYEQLGDKPNARFYLGTLVKEYPRSSAAKTATDALQGRLK